MSGENLKNHAAFIWSVADLLRGDYKPSEYGKVILPLTVLRRLDCVLEPTKSKVLERAKKLKGSIDNVGPVLQSVAGEQFYNTSPLDFRRLLDDPNQLASNLRAYVAGFSPAAQDVIEKFNFDTQITKMDRANLLYLVLSKFAELDLHPTQVSNIEMGYLYEELIRRFSELSNETAGEHFTPREVIRLMVNLLFIEDADVLARPGTVRTIFDPACGTGGMLSVAEDYLRELNPAARLEVFGQELNEETYAICRSDMMLKGQDASHIAVGNSFSEDGHAGRTFDYCLANPPFGVEWKKVEDVIRLEAEKMGFAGRFGAGLPRINDGSFLFLQHMIAKMKPVEEGGSRIAIVFNGSPLFTGAAGSGESEIRRWIIENDWLEAVVALPDQLFYNTGISTYFWIVTNRKSEERKGKVQLVDAREFFTKMRKSLGEKRKEISAEQVNEITRLYAGFEDGEHVRILPNHAFGFMRITVERPKRTKYVIDEEGITAALALPEFRSLPQDAANYVEWLLRGWLGADFPDEKVGPGLQPYNKLVGYLTGAAPDVAPIPEKLAKSAAKAIQAQFLRRDDSWPVVVDGKGRSQPDPDLSDSETVPMPPFQAAWRPDREARMQMPPFKDAVDAYMATEVLPYVPDAWVDHEKTKIGYEIPLTRYFYKYVPPRTLSEIDAEIQELEAEIGELLRGVTE